MNILIKHENSGKYFSSAFSEFGFNTTLIDTQMIVDTLNRDIHTMTYNILILDTQDKDSFDMAKFVKKRYNMGVVFISKNESLDMKLKAFTSGADDYILSKTSILEIVARLRSICSRCSGNIHTTQKIVGDIKIDYAKREISRAGKIMSLTTKEFQILDYLIANKNILLTRSHLKEHLWGIDFVSDTNIVDVYVARVRRKIDNDYDKKYITTVRGSGYIFKI